MRLRQLADLEPIALRIGFSIFELPKDLDLSTIFPHALHLTPDEKNTISVDKLQNLIALSHNKTTSDLVFCLESPELITRGQNDTILKLLEEPNQNIHFVFLSHDISKIPQTILSRAQTFYLPTTDRLTDPPKIDPKTLNLAKTYLTTPANRLPAFIKTLPKTKDPRAQALTLIRAAITLSYKSYFRTGNSVFLKKLRGLLAAESAISKNGNIKLQLIANLL